MADEASRHHHNLTVLASHGVDLVRFAAAPYCPNHFALWRSGGANRTHYWSMLDDIVREAEAAGVRLIPTIMWRVRLLPMVCEEPMHRLFVEKTCASRLLEEYATQLVWHLSGSPAVVAWELMNELDLQADGGDERKLRRPTASEACVVDALRARLTALGLQQGI